jgi:ferredoxin
MAKTINQDLCIQCDLCLNECPNEGIAVVEDQYIIDPRLCTECAGVYETSRCSDVCPVDAVEDGPAEEAETLISRAADVSPQGFPRD